MRHDFSRITLSALAVLMATCAPLLAQAEKQAKPASAKGSRREPPPAAAKNLGVPGQAGDLRAGGAIPVTDPQRAANFERLAQQVVQQGLPAVRAELIFVRHLCHLSREDFRTLQRESEAALRDVATRYIQASQPDRPVSGVLLQMNGRSSRSRDLDVAASLQATLINLMKRNLTGDQFATYRRELDLRAARAKESALKYLVEAIDLELYLADDQREKITEGLAKHWNDSWTASLEYFLYGSQVYPIGIDHYVSPILNNTQRKVWQGLQKLQAGGGFGLAWRGVVNDGGLDIELGEEVRPGPGATAGSKKENRPAPGSNKDRGNAAAVPKP